MTPKLLRYPVPEADTPGQNKIPERKARVPQMEILYKKPREISMMELKRDSVFRKIASDRYDELIAFAWERGEISAIKYIEKLSTTIPSEMIAKLNITIMCKNWEKGKSKIQFYSEYADKPTTITLYENSIGEAIESAMSHGYNQITSLMAAKEVFLSHELYHYIECRDIGLASKEHKVVMLKAGPFQLTSGIRALCEIGAHAFSKFLLKKNNYYRDIQ